MRFRNLLAIACGALAASAALSASPADQGPPPIALQEADQIAWETFVQVMAPSGNPTTTNVEFETWASDRDIYGVGGPHWPAVNEPKVLQPSGLGLAHFRHGVSPLAIGPSDCVNNYDPVAARAAGFPSDGCIGEEVRRNWASYQYIVSNGLYTKAGLAAAFARNLQVDLPADAVELKADWVPVATIIKWSATWGPPVDEAAVRKLYYTNAVTGPAGPVQYALVALHFSTKQQKNWVWADFEHRLNPGRCDDIGCNDRFGATAASVKPNAQSWKPYGDCRKTPRLLAMLANAGLPQVWENYCLKGSQTGFGAAGNPTLLGNSVIEAINAGVPIGQSSCISCHAYASFDKDGASNENALGLNATGPVDPKNLNGYRQDDFLWGSRFAR